MSGFSHTKIIKTLKVLSQNDQKELLLFLQSPYFNKNESITRLYQFLLQFSPDFEHPDMNYPKAYYYIYGEDKPYIEKGLTMLRTKFQKKIENFICQQEIKEDDFAKKIALLQFYEKKGLTEQAKKLKKKYDKYKEKNVRSFMQDFMIENKLHTIRTSNVKTIKDSKNIDQDAVLKALDKFYLMQKAVFLSFNINNKIIHSLDKTITLDLTPQNYFNEKENAIYKIWEKAFLSMDALIDQSGNTSELYNNFKKALFKYANLFKKNDIINICIFIQTIINRNKAITRLKIFTEMFDLYDLQVNQNALGGKMLIPPIFRNMITICHTLDRTEWLFFFTRKNEQRIQNFNDGLYEVALASYHLKKQNQMLALALLRDANYKLKDLNKVFLFRLKIMIYYEQEQDDLLDNTINNFSVWLSNLNQKNETTTALLHFKKMQQNQNRTFIKTCNSLFKLSTTIMRSERVEALTKISNKLLFLIEKVDVVEKGWLLQKMEDNIDSILYTSIRTQRQAVKASYTNPTNEMAMQKTIKVLNQALEQKELNSLISYKEANLYFLDFVQQLSHSNNIEQLETNICAQKKLIDYTWLLQQIQKKKSTAFS